MLQLNLERFSKTLMNLYKGMQISTAKWESGTFFVCALSTLLCLFLIHKSNVHADRVILFHCHFLIPD